MSEQSNKPTGFQYNKTKSIIRYSWRNGSWNEGQLSNEETFSLPFAATALHYGQSAFEGLKAFRWEDQSIRVFRPQLNAQRLQQSCRRLLMPEVPESLFLEALKRVITDNHKFVPKYDEGSLYIRPIVFGSGATIGVRPSDEYEFIILVTPVGDYYSSTQQGMKALVAEQYDRAAPQGTGAVKAAGNYAGGLLPSHLAKQQGYDIVLYLDAKTQCYIEEFGTSNFVAIDKNGTYVTPESSTILNSITNQSLMEICKGLDIPTEKRKIKIEELNDFNEIGACGTAVVVTPIDSIDFGNNTLWKQSQSHEVLNKIRLTYKQIQLGQTEDRRNWMYQV